MQKAIQLLLVMTFIMPNAADAAGTSWGAERPLAYLAVADQGYWQVWLMDGEGKGGRQISNSPYDKNSVSWHPDGDRLLVNGNQGELVWLRQSEADKHHIGTEEPLSLPVSGMTDARLSPDGERIVFSLNISGGVSDDNNIWLVDRDGKNLKKLTNMSGVQHEPRWHPNNEHIYFLSKQREQAHDIWALTLSSMSLTQVTASTLYNLDIAISNDNRLTYSSNRSGDYQLYAQSLDDPSGKATALTSGSPLDANPAWSPDNRYLAFDSIRTGRPNIWRLDVGENTLQQLSFHKQGARRPVWYNARVAQ